MDPAKGWARREGMLTPESLEALARHYHGLGVARFWVYESTTFTWFPEVRRAIREAGWADEPAKKG